MLATVLFSTYGGGGRMSPLTLALLQDTGWYDVNMTQAGYMEWGRNAGCGFLKDSCWSFMKSNPEQPYFCNSTKTSACRADCAAAGHAPSCGQLRPRAAWQRGTCTRARRLAQCPASAIGQSALRPHRARPLPDCPAAGALDASSDQSYTCTFTAKSQGYCRPVAFADGCSMVQSALVGAATCSRPDRAYPGSDQFGWINGPNSRCYPVTYRCAGRRGGPPGARGPAAARLPASRPSCP
jgi:hypothetical protein